jgi:hypothetical protein
MEVKARHIYDQSVDVVFKKFGNKASIERKFKELGARNIHVETCKLTKTSLDLVMSREIPVNAPSLLKKFLGEWNLAHQEEHWKGIAGKSYQGNVKMTIKGVPVTITGKMVLAGDATGCINDVTLTIESGIPLLGKKLAEFVGQTSVTEMQREYEHIKGSMVTKKPSTRTVTAKPVSAKTVAKAAATKSVKTPATKASTNKLAAAKTAAAKPPIKAAGVMPSAKSVTAKPAAKKVAKKSAMSDPAAKNAVTKSVSKPATAKKPASKKKGE